MISKRTCGGFGQRPLRLQERCVYVFAKVVLAGRASEHLDLHSCIGRETGSHTLGLEETAEHQTSAQCKYPLDHLREMTAVS